MPNEDEAKHLNRRLQLPNPITVSDISRNKIQAITIVDEQKKYVAEKAIELFEIAEQLGLGRTEDSTVSHWTKKVKQVKKVFRKTNTSDLEPEVVDLLVKLDVDVDLFNKQRPTTNDE